MDIMVEIKPIGELFKNGKYSAALRELELLWKKIPSPKEETMNSYMLVAYGATIALKNADLGSAWVWAQRGLPYSGKFNLAGESEFLMGEVAFARSDLETAKSYFKKVEKNSGKRLFKGKNPQFLDLIK